MHVFIEIHVVPSLSVIFTIIENFQKFFSQCYISGKFTTIIV